MVRGHYVRSEFLSIREALAANLAVMPSNFYGTVPRLEPVRAELLGGLEQSSALFAVVLTGWRCSHVFPPGAHLGRHMRQLEATSYVPMVTKAE
jgi:hypothetical protein